MEITPPLSHDTNQYLPHIDHNVSNISKHLYNFKETLQLNKFYHATFFSPAKTAFLDVMKKGYLQGCPDLTYQSAKQHITHNELANIKGNLNQTW